jgi:hypothetical protein
MPSVYLCHRNADTILAKFCGFDQQQLQQLTQKAK